MVLLGDGIHGLLQHAVNAVLDVHRVVASFDVNVAGPPLQRGEDGGVHQANDGTDVAFGGQPLDGDSLVAALIFADHVQGEALAGFFQHALRLLRLFEDVGDLRKGGDLGDDALAQQQANFVNHHQLAGIGNSDGQPPILRLLQGDEVVAEHQVYRDLLEQVVVELEIAQVNVLAAIAPRNIPRPRESVGRSFGGDAPAVPAVHEE